MKAITLIQPWATLIAHGEKQVETRSWKTQHRGPLAIHAGKKIDYEACKIPEIKIALARHGYINPDMLPTSAIISVCNLFDCVEMKTDINSPSGCRVPGYKISANERVFGDYRPGRFAWILAGNRILRQPVPAKGKLMLWDWNEAGITKTSKFEGQQWD